jgi:hypothetical protein
MGINAQTSVPKFTAGDTLTAANTNLLSNGIPVFGGTALRNDAFGGSGEKVLAEGQFAYLEDTNTTQYYDGAAWQSVGASGLVFITSGTVAAGSTLSFNNCFSATYANYLIVTNASSGTSYTMRLRASGSDINAANYFVSGGFIASGAQTLINLTSQTAMSMSNAGNPFNLSTVVCNPFATANTTFTNSSQRADSGTFEQTGCLYNATTSADGFSILGTSITVTARVYGYANS